MTEKDSILRRSRFSAAQDESVSGFLSSIEQDERIFHADLWVDKAHVVMLHKQGLLPPRHAASILRTLDALATEWQSLLSQGAEDVHLLIETELIERLGEEIGGRLHTGRSRNDEVATCLRIALREEILSILEGVMALQRVLLHLASDNVETIMPGYTHLQHAQATTLGHHLVAHAASLQRDAQRLMDCFGRVNISPLGAGALASTGLPINPAMTARLLAFPEVSINSMDAVASRDFATEALSALSIMAVNLSRLAEELVLWSSAEFGFISLADEYSSTSSIMPQKRNPDVAELSRARTSSVLGCLLSALSICSSLPLAYDRDLQEVGLHLWRGTGTSRSVLKVLKGVLSTLTVNREEMAKQSQRGFMWATDLADLLVDAFHLPFRQSHSLVARLARDWSEERDADWVSRQVAVASKDLLGREITLSPEQIRSVMDLHRGIRRKKVGSGPSPRAVRKQIHLLSQKVEETLSWVGGRRGEIARAQAELSSLQSSLENGEA